MRRPLTRALWFVALLLALGVAVVALRPGEASAHAVLERSSPAQGQKIPLADVPDLVETWYSEPLERPLTSVRVLDTAGSPVHTGDTVFSDDQFYAAVALPADLGPGIYTASYTNVSQADGHTWSGSFSFIVLNADGSVPPGQPVELKGPGAGQGYLPSAAETAMRWIGMVAAVMIAGAAGFLLLVARPAGDFLDDDRRARVQETSVAQAASLTLLAGPLVFVSVCGEVLLLADRLGGLDNLDTILLDTRGGQLWLSQIGIAIAFQLLALPLLLSPAFRQSGQGGIVFVPALIGALGLLMTYSLGSHANAGAGQFWSVASDFVHFVATAGWLGGLLQLPLILWWTQRRLEEPDRVLYRANVLDRYSWLSVVSVALLIGTGTFNGFVQLPNFPSLYETTYGRVLIAKLALIIPLLGVAALNAIFVKPALVRAIDDLHGGDRSARPKGAELSRTSERLARLQRLLPRTAALEFALGVAVLVSVAVLAQTTTASGELRSDAAKPSGSFESSVVAEDVELRLLIEPFGIGVSTYTVELTPASGGELGEVQGVRLRAFFDDPNRPIAAGVSGTDLDLEPTGEPAVWSTESALLTQPGNWEVQVRIQRRDADDLATTLTVREVGGFLARGRGPDDLFDLPFTFVDWNIVAGGAMLVLGIGALLIWRNRPPTWQRGTGASVALSSAASLMAGVVLLFGVSADHADLLLDNPIERTPDSVAAGKLIYDNNCQVCHGADGKGGNRAADLTLHVPAHGDGTLFFWISEGLPLDSERKDMPSWKDRLSATGRWNVVNYLKAAFGSGQFEPVLPPDLQPTPSGVTR
jgi:copper transport protein